MSESRCGPPPPDITSLVQSLVQQQTAIFQQQAALLQVHGESIRLQRLLIERLLGSATELATVTPAPAAEPPQWMSIPGAAPAPLSPVAPGQ